MFTVVITCPHRSAPSVYHCSTLGFARAMAQTSYGEQGFIYDDQQKLVERSNGDNCTVDIPHIIIKA